MATTYLTFALFRGRTILPKTYCDEVENNEPNWIDSRIGAHSRWIESRLRKNYSTPFAAWDDPDPTPETIQEWITILVTLDVYLKRGADPSDLQFDIFKQAYDSAKEEVLEAANSENGWFDLPLKSNEDGSALDRVKSRSYTEQSPYVGFDLQEATGRTEDENGSGSYG